MVLILNTNILALPKNYSILSMKVGIEELLRDSKREQFRILGIEERRMYDVMLDANENSNGSISGAFYNHFPDSLQTNLREAWANVLSVNANNIAIGHGLDQVYDWILNLFVEPCQDAVVIVAPSSCNFSRRALIHGALLKYATWNPDEPFNSEKIVGFLTPEVKLLYMATPNDPTGMPIPDDVLDEITQSFNGIIAINESYLDFKKPNYTNYHKYNNIICIRTLDYAWGMAGLQLSAMISPKTIINIVNAIKNKYNINSITQSLAIQTLRFAHELKDWVAKSHKAREKWVYELQTCSSILKIYPSETNFIMVRLNDARAAYEKLIAAGIKVMDVSSLPYCENCLRLTVGNSVENRKVVEVLETL